MGSFSGLILRSLLSETQSLSVDINFTKRYYLLIISLILFSNISKNIIMRKIKLKNIIKVISLIIHSLTNLLIHFVLFLQYLIHL